MKNTIALTATLAVIAGGLSLADLSPNALSMSAQAQETAPETDAGTAESNAEVTVEEMSMGNPDAEVTVIEYASFTCPHCGNFHETVFEDLKANYIDTDQINFIYREVYFNRDLASLWAGMVARCGGSDRYFGIVDLIYEQQQDWTQGEPEQIVANLRRIGKTAGLTDAQLDSCLSDGAEAEALVETSVENASADEITSTPSFVIDGTKYSNMSYEEFSSILDEKLDG